ncbi:hypothetical protein Bca52824_073361 [Brassica carinata]|uniref:Uncharacterized protein n=1 Tax=Brassica carinata TaxID=52824 RepID=A0A8X7U563_BRACI|nr:hypothetical protein Bca52824_073361 [Brassica carinata]
MSRSFFSLHSIGHLKKKRESESESGVATAQDGAPAMVSSSMMLPVYPSPSISYSEASWKHNKKFAKELSIEEEDHQLRSWFLHRRCSCALLRHTTKTPRITHLPLSHVTLFRKKLVRQDQWDCLETTM